jgi:Fe-S-cluster-containing dehydrogenase component
MTSLSAPAGGKRLGLVIDLDTCVGCHACATSCKEWNTSAHSAPLTDVSAYQAGQRGVWLNRVFSYEAGGAGPQGRTVHFPKNCLHCEKPDCVTVCPTGASYKRAEDGIVLINQDTCIGCQLCAWACPYGARELDEDVGVMKKCTLCVDKIYNETLPEAERVPACVSTCPAKARHFGDFADPQSNVSRLTRERGGFDLMEELGYRPTSKYLPPRPGRRGEAGLPRALAPAEPSGGEPINKFLRWVDRALTR